MYLPSDNLELINSVVEVNESPRRLNIENRWTSKLSTTNMEYLNVNGKCVNTAVGVSANIAAPLITNAKDREHVQIFDKIFILFSTYAKVVGIDTSYHWIPHRSIMLALVILLTMFTWLCIFYTQFVHIKNGDILKVLEACAIYGVSSSCTQKLFGYLKKRNHIMSIFFCIRKMCHQTECGSQADILTFNLLRTFRFLKMFAVGVMSGVGLFVACPFKSYVFDNELIPLLPLEIIFVDQASYSGFAIANIVMIVMGLFAALGTILYGTTFIFAVLMYAMQVDLFGQDFKDLDSMWEEDSTASLACKHALLQNICNKSQDIKNFMDAVKHIFQTKFFYYFCFNYLSQIICLFEIAKNQWLPGYGIALALFIEMMFYCVMGSQIAIADDRLCSSIYTCNWCSYDIKSQKIVISLLHRSQQSQQLQLGPLGPLSVATGVEVIKSIYSYYTVLTEVL